MPKAFIAFLLLMAGLVAYWIFRPEVAVLQWLGLHSCPAAAFPPPVNQFMRNHFPDLAWCASAYTVVRLFREARYPPAYGWGLMGLPFLSEFAQALHVIPGTFDWWDLLIYAVLFIAFYGKEIALMSNCRQHLVAGTLVSILVFAVLGSGGPTYKFQNGTFKLPPQKTDEVWSKPSLARIMRNSKNRAVVLRVPAASKDITTEQSKLNDVVYNTIEKELAKAGFTVRDRPFFSKVLEQGASDYSRISILTETDLILELVRYQYDVPYTTDEYVDEAGSLRKTPRSMLFNGALIEFKITGVKESEMVGTMTFHFSPCTAGCTRRFIPEMPGSTRHPLNHEAVAKDFALRLVAQLNQYQ